MGERRRDGERRRPCRRAAAAWAAAAAVLAALAAALLLLPVEGACAEADALLAQGAYVEAAEAYLAVLGRKEERAALYGRAAEGFLQAAQAQMAAQDGYRALSERELFPAAEALFALCGASDEACAALRQLAAEADSLLLAAQAREAFDAFDFAGAYALLAPAQEDARAQALLGELRAQQEGRMDELTARWDGRLGAGAWYTVLVGEAPAVAGDARYAASALPAEAERVYAGLFGMLFVQDGRAVVYGDPMGTQQAVLEEAAGVVSAAMGANHAAVLTGDGRVLAAGSNASGQCDVSDWQEVSALAAGAFHTLGLTGRGTVLAAGDDTAGQCGVTDWTEVVMVAAGLNHSVGLRQDGTVVACGDNTYGQCDVSGWRDVIRIACGGNHTLALTADHRVLAAGDNRAGQCDVAAWTDVVALAGGLWHSVAVRADGRLVAAGSNDNGQCGVAGLRAYVATPDGVPLETEYRALTELVYAPDPEEGPWLYCGGDGAVLVARDGNYPFAATRADLISARGTLPEGILAGGGDVPRGFMFGPMLARQNRAVFALSGDYFSFDYNRDGIQIRCGTVFGTEGEEVGIAFFPDGTMRVVDPAATTAEELMALGVRDAWAFGPLLVRDGAACDISGHPLSYNDVTLRGAIGTLGAHHHIALATGSGTLADVTQAFLAYGCTLAYNLDGGRSVCMTFLGEAVNSTLFDHYGVRRLQDMVGFLHSEQVPQLGEPYVNRRW